MTELATKTSFADLLDTLNPAQRSAVDAPDGPLLIFAGAGSGKTRVLTHRIAYVIANRGVQPGQICAVTFTNKAAREMRGRVEALVGASTDGMWLGTFHSLGARILRRDGDALGIRRDYSIYDEDDRAKAVGKAMQAAEMDTRRLSIARVVDAISGAKNELKDAKAYRSAAQDFYEELIARVYTAYEKELEASNALDFDDLLGMTVRLLNEVDTVRDKYQERFHHVFVDEYQDTNLAQYQMVKLLSGKYRNLTVVGDDDQSIFRWRGADVRNILSFKTDFPDAIVVTLEQNYRSSQNILDAAHGVIKLTPGRAEKKLWTDKGAGEPVKLSSVYDEREEAAQVAAEIEKLVGRGESLSECAVLYRTNAQSRAFEDLFVRRGIPYRLVGGVRFYERREIKDVLAYLRLAVNPLDSVAFGRIVNVPRRKLGDKTVAEIEKAARKQGVSPLELVKDLPVGLDVTPGAKTALKGFAELMAQLSADSTHFALPVLIKRVLQDTGYLDYLQDGTEEAEDRISNVEELVGLADDYADQEPPEGLFNFLEHVALIMDVDNLDDTASGATLITLHQVKGLEFDHVFMTGMEEGTLPHVRSIEDGAEALSEERRLTYVGMTRARKHLYLSFAFRRFLRGSSQMAEPSRFLADLPAEVIQHVRGVAPSVVTRSVPNGVRNALAAHAVKPSAPVSQEQKYQEGVRVTHARYGAGVILKSTMTRSGEEVVIRFDEAGVKIFAVSDAKLTPA